MTVCVAVKVYDCIVLATDSATSLSSRDEEGREFISNIYDNGNKLFNLHKKLPVAAMTAGIGNFGRSSISSLSKDLRRRFTDGDSDWRVNTENYNVEQIARKARQFLFEERFQTLEAKPQGSFDYWIAGYSSDEEHGEIWRISIQDGNCPEPIFEADKDTSTIKWGGQPEAINRLLLGYGQQLPRALLEAGLSPDKLPALMGHIAARTQAPVLSDGMPVIDAIELALFLVDTTKKFIRFNPGGNTVGGAVDAATLTKHEGFKWVSRKHYYPKDLNPLETDHV